jgi:chromosome segregation ATPase
VKLNNQIKGFLDEKKHLKNEIAEKDSKLHLLEIENDHINDKLERFKKNADRLNRKLTQQKLENLHIRCDTQTQTHFDYTDADKSISHMPSLQ